MTSSSILRNHNKKYKYKDLVNVNTGIILFYPAMTHKDQMEFLTLNHRHSWARSHLFSQSNCRLEFHEVANYFFASRFPVFHFFYAYLRYFDLMHQPFVYVQQLAALAVSPVSAPCFPADNFQDYKNFFDQEKHENNLLESNKKDSFDTLKRNTKGKYCFRKNFWQISKSPVTVLSV